MKRTRFFAVLMAGALILSRMGGATGLLLPRDRDLPALGIKSHRVEVEIKDGVATTELTEVFYNSTKRQLEATFIFPVPTEAALTDFALYINGTRTSGKVINAEEARQTYEEIVRRMRDPGLLEYIGQRMLKMRVFPIPPNSTRKIEVRYSQTVPFDAGLYRYTFPLKTGEKASRVLEDFTFQVDIHSRHDLANIYSPSHRIGVSRKDAHHAVVGFEESEALLNRDFRLYFSVTQKEFGLNLLTYREKGEDGYFALMLAPRLGIEQQDVMPKDVCFAIDTSGSMLQEERMNSAKDALRFCLNALGKRDLFALVPFSTGVETFQDELQPASQPNVKKALGYVEDLEARGGTNLAGAVVRALKLAPDGDRPYIVVVITDGQPTIGVVEPGNIVAEVKNANARNARVFTFGTAESLDVPLLDSIAEVTGGYSQYVAPGRAIEAEISAFFRKVSHPVLTNLKLDFGTINVRDVWPAQLPDLFRGSQVLAFGRYSDSGEVAVRLSGTMKDKKRTFAYDANFPRTDPDNAFVSHLWAQRKIAYLLDELRLHGEKKELRDEVIRLSKEYGIATPYTSYLVLEDEDQYVRHGLVDREALRAAGRAGPSPTSEPEAPARKLRRQEARELQNSGAYFGGAADAAAPRGGRKAVDISETMRRWKEVRTAEEGGLTRARTTLKRVDDKTFVRIRGVYVDTDFREDLKELRIRFGSPAYFAVLRALPELKPYLSVGAHLILVRGDRALIVGEEGSTTMDEAQIRDFFGQ
jgi:Ca-activated chloride channel family protein